MRAGVCLARLHGGEKGNQTIEGVSQRIGRITHPILARRIESSLLLLLLLLLLLMLLMLVGVNVGLLASDGSNATLRDHADLPALMGGTRHCHELVD